MTQPFFSVLLPTKNRSEVVAGALESMLNQTFGDFELVISDNDDSDTATRQVVSPYTDSRIRYHRTSGKLPMHENWENALTLARGRHVLVLEDKMRLVPNALELLHALLQEHGDVVISYDSKFVRGPALRGPEHRPPVELWRSQRAIESFCRFAQGSFNLLPKGLDSCVPLALAQRVKQRSRTGYFFSYITPDYASAFQLLSVADSFLYLKSPLVYIPNNWMWQGKYSNGMDSYKKVGNYKRFLESVPVTRDEIVAAVPIKSEWLWLNLLVCDFLKHYSRPDHHPQLDWADYHAFVATQLVIARRVGGTMDNEVAALKASLRQNSLTFKLRVGLSFGCRGFDLLWRMIKGRIEERRARG